jgi:glycosyltransferase involved in cell wall biosynthesis
MSSSSLAAADRRDVARPTPTAPIRPVRVTNVIHCMLGGGMELILAAIARRMVGTDVTMSIITLDGQVGPVGEQIVGEVEAIIPMRPTPFVSMFAPLGLAATIRETRPDVVHLYSGAWWKGALAARLAGVKSVVYSEHGLQHEDSPLAPLLFRSAAALTDVVVTVSDRLRDDFGSRLGLPAERVMTIENGVDTKRFSPGEPPAGLRASLGLPADALVVGSVGRLEPVKSYDLLIDAFAELLREDGHARPPYLVLCGSGSQREALEAHARARGVLERVRFAGWSDQPRDYYRLYDVFALSSISEGAPMSLMEAMATGAVPVCTDVGAIRQIMVRRSRRRSSRRRATWGRTPASSPTRCDRRCARATSRTGRARGSRSTTTWTPWWTPIARCITVSLADAARAVP